MSDLRLQKSSIFEFVFIGGILGYPLVSGLSASFGLPNSLMSLLFRSVIALVALYLLIDGVGCAKPRWRRFFLTVIGLFFLAYFTRLFYSTLVQPSSLSAAPSHYWMWAVGAALLPAIGLAGSRQLPIDWSATQKRFLFIGIIAAILVAANITTQFTNAVETYDSGRARLETLNPIALGHLGASLMLASLVLLIGGQEQSRMLKLLAISAFVFGIALVIASNSRGPLFASTAALLFCWVTLRGRHRLLMTLLAILLILSFVSLLAFFETRFGVTTYSRLLGQSFAEEQNVVARMELYGAAFEAFSRNLVFGAGLELHEIGSYPHNVTIEASIEAFLATGLLGGLFFLVLEVAVLLAAWRICLRDRRFIWAATIAVQYLVASQFSGSIFTAAQFWTVIGLIAFGSAVLTKRTP